MFADKALMKLIDRLPKGSRVLDIGSGSGVHAKLMEDAGLSVTALAYTEDPTAIRKPDIICDYLSNRPKGPRFDAIWASHVLEHSDRPGEFISKMMVDCKQGGLIAITVPPAKDSIVGGHLTLWNPGLLLYNLIYQGLDCSNADIGRYGYNISVIAPNVWRPNVSLNNDSGDIDKLSPYFPYPFKERDDGWERCPTWS